MSNQPRIGDDGELQREKFCVHCGMANARSANYCAYCGASLTANKWVRPPTPNEPLYTARPIRSNTVSEWAAVWIVSSIIEGCIWLIVSLIKFIYRIFGPAGFVALAVVIAVLLLIFAGTQHLIR